MTTRNLSAFAALSAVLAVAGCGSSGDSTTKTTADSSSRINAICKQAITSASADELPTSSAAIIKIQSRAARTFSDAADQVAALPLDPQQKDWLAQFREVAAANGEAAQAARRDGIDSDAFLKAGTSYEEAVGGSNAAAAKAGLQDCTLGSVTNAG